MNVTEMTYMDYLEIDDMLDMNVKEWYLEAYPTDECGHYISDNATFRGVYSALLNKEDVYDYIGECDSVIRERLFAKLAEIMEVDYDYIYDQWIGA